jgi:xanthine/uracil permease
MIKRLFKPVVLHTPIVVIDLAMIKQAAHAKRLRQEARREKWELIKYKLAIASLAIVGVMLMLAMGAGLMLMSRALPY